MYKKDLRVLLPGVKFVEISTGRKFMVLKHEGTMTEVLEKSTQRSWAWPSEAKVFLSE